MSSEPCSNPWRESFFIGIPEKHWRKKLTLSSSLPSVVSSPLDIDRVDSGVVGLCVNEGGNGAKDREVLSLSLPLLSLLKCCKVSVVPVVRFASVPIVLQMDSTNWC